MARPLWSGDLAFGIVSIPVRMYAAVREHDLHFHQISRTDRKRIRYRKVAEGSEDEVPAKDIVKGYEVRAGEYVVFDDEELRQLAARKSKAIEIRDFVDLSEIDPRLFDRPYYLVPQERGAKPYQLLVEALARSARVGIAQMVMHGKEHLVAVRSIDGLLCVLTMHFADELVRPRDLEDRPKAAHVSDKELDMAERLIDTMTTAFAPEEYTDEYRERVRDFIAKKSRGKPFTLAESETAEAGGDDGKVIDLMEALRRSLARTKGRKNKAPARSAQGDAGQQADDRGRDDRPRRGQRKRAS